jgi:catechol 2,3-dioxygenase-like lactoylglutathione lyase family enzyme
MKKPAKFALAAAPVVAFVPTKDFKAARRFYETTLDLPLMSHDKFALVFEAGDTRIRLAKIAEFHPAPFTVLGWRVVDITAAVTALAKRGVAFERFEGMPQDEHAIWAAPSGARVAWFKDPDGNLLSLSQHND